MVCAIWAVANASLNLRAVLDIRLRPVAACGYFAVPLAVGRLILDRFGASGNPLFGGGASCGGNCRGMTRKRLGEYTIDGIGPAAVVLDDLVG